VHPCISISYALEVCDMSERDLQSLDVNVNRFFMKLLRRWLYPWLPMSSNFYVDLPSVVIKKRFKEFENYIDR